MRFWILATLVSQTNIGTVSKAMLGKPLRELFRAHRYHLELNWSIQQAVEVKQERV